MSALKSAPAAFTLTPRNPERAIHVGGNHVSFILVAGPPNVHDCVIASVPPRVGRDVN